MGLLIRIADRTFFAYDFTAIRGRCYATQRAVILRVFYLENGNISETRQNRTKVPYDGQIWYTFCDVFDLCQTDLG